MLQIIPAIDLIDGRCVRLTEGDYSRQTTYDAAPDDMVRRFVDCGAQRVHVVDLDGAKAAAPVNLRVLERLATIGDIDIEWGGGLKTEKALSQAFDAGADYAVVGSTAARRPDLFAAWLDRFGPERLVLGADVRDGKIAVDGWQTALDMTVEQLIDRFTPHGLSQLVCTDISRDGRLAGPAIDLYADLQALYPDVDVTVSGGISSMADIEALAERRLRRVIVGKAIYEHRIALADIADWNAKHPINNA